MPLNKLLGGFNIRYLFPLLLVFWLADASEEERGLKDKTLSAILEMVKRGELLDLSSNCEAYLNELRAIESRDPENAVAVAISNGDLDYLALGVGFVPGIRGINYESSSCTFPAPVRQIIVNQPVGSCDYQEDLVKTAADYVKKYNLEMLRERKRRELPTCAS